MEIRRTGALGADGLDEFPGLVIAEGDERIALPNGLDLTPGALVEVRFVQSGR